MEIEIAYTKDIAPGNMVGVEKNGKAVLIANVNGTYYAIGNICTHMGCNLSKGILTEDKVQCACHGSVFNVKTGAVEKGPTEIPEPSYRLRVDGDRILADLDVKVPFTKSNAKKCICWQCPVQADSDCIKKNEEKMGEVMSTKFFEPEIVPGLYCSSGVASCKDIDTSQTCICYKCPVFVDYNLAEGQPIDHYCKNGNAK